MVKITSAEEWCNCNKCSETESELTECYTYEFRAAQRDALEAAASQCRAGRAGEKECCCAAKVRALLPERGDATAAPRRTYEDGIRKAAEVIIGEWWPKSRLAVAARRRIDTLLTQLGGK